MEANGVAAKSEPLVGTLLLSDNAAGNTGSFQVPTHSRTFSF